MRKLRLVDTTPSTVKNAEDPIVPPPPPRIHKRFPNSALIAAGAIGAVLDHVVRMLF